MLRHIIRFLLKPKMNFFDWVSTLVGMMTFWITDYKMTGIVICVLGLIISVCVEELFKKYL